MKHPKRTTKPKIDKGEWTDIKIVVNDIETYGIQKIHPRVGRVYFQCYDKWWSIDSKEDLFNIKIKKKYENYN